MESSLHDLGPGKRRETADSSADTQAKDLSIGPEVLIFRASGLFTNSVCGVVGWIAAWGMAGVGLGLAVWVAIVSQAHSYLSDAPEVCVNCHVMRSVYASWSHSSHREVATCNDCHVPHETFLAHWLFKARDGLRHATVFTLRREPQVMHLSADAEPVVEANCRRCHEAALRDIALSVVDSTKPRCWHCHRSPHSEPHSLSSFGGWISGH